MPSCVRTGAWYPHAMPIETLRAWYPNLTDDELRLAAENLDLYLEIAWEVMEEMDVTHMT